MGILILLAFAWPVTPAAATELPASPDDPLHVVLVVGGSDSLRQHDPAGLGLTAANLFIDLLDADDQLGLLAFADDVEVLAAPAPLGPWPARLTLKERVDGISPSGFTHTAAALTAAHAMLTAQNAPRGGGMVVLLSDGEPQLPQLDQAAQRQAYMDQLWVAVDAFALQGWPVHTVAVRDQGFDLHFLHQVALRSGGHFTFVDAIEELPRALVRLAGAVQLREELLVEAASWQDPDEVQRRVIQVDAYTQRLTAGLTAADASSFSLQLVSPAGQTHAADASLFGGGGDRYRLVGVEEPAAGAWELHIAGQGAAEIFVAADKTVRLALTAPPPFARQPWQGRFAAEVALLHAEPPEGQEWEVTASIDAPGRAATTPVPLAPAAAALDGHSQRFGADLGVLTGLGIHQLHVEARRGGERVSQRVFPFQVDVLPFMVWESLDRRDYRLGERVTLRLEYATGGEILAVGSDFQVEMLQAWLRPLDGSRTLQIPLAGQDLESGELPVVSLQQAAAAADAGGPLQVSGAAAEAATGTRDFGAGLDLDRQGEYDVLLRTTGAYHGRAFTEVLPAGRLQVHPQGTISWALVDDAAVRVAPGRTRTFRLRFISEAFQPETVRLTGQGGSQVSMEPQEITLAPAAETVAAVAVTYAGAAEPGSRETLELHLATAASGVTVMPAQRRLTVEAVSPWELFGPTGTWGLRAALLLGALLTVFFGGGGLLYALRAPGGQRRARLKGHLDYAAAGAADWQGSVPLSRARGGRFVVASDDGGAGEPAAPVAASAELRLPQRDRTFRFVLQAPEQTVAGPWFLAGWRTLKHSGPDSLVEVIGQERTRIEMAGFIRVGSELAAGDGFQVGGYRFRYRS